MDMKHFVDAMRRLERKYSRDKITKGLVNEVWKSVKQYEDSYITAQVDRLMTSKSVWGDKFTLPDFFPLKKEEVPADDDSEVTEKKKEQKKLYMRHAEYKPPVVKKEKDPEALKNALKQLGATSVQEAMQKILDEKRKEEKKI